MTTDRAKETANGLFAVPPVTEEERYFLHALLDMAWAGGMKNERASLCAHAWRAKVPKPEQDPTAFQKAFIEAWNLRKDDDDEIARVRQPEFEPPPPED